MTKRVLCVGNCVPDTRAISTLIEENFSAEVQSAESLLETMELLGAKPFDLVLVNRILDRDGSSGLDVIQKMKSAPDLQHIPVMMITNFPEHQQTAQEAGAIEGFGKQAINAPETVARLGASLA